MDRRTQVGSGSTHRGLVRTRNEDAFWIGDDSWALADGMGGGPSGDIASRQAVRSVSRVLGAGGEDVEWALLEAVLAAHTDIERSAKRWPAHAGMGTTVVAAYRNGAGELGIVHVGDSRAYLLKDGRLVRLTTDDNEAADLLALGEIDEDQARVHPGQSWLTKALGLQQDVAPFPTIQVLPQAVGRLLLCSDGLTGDVEDYQIEALLSAGSPRESCESLIAAALTHGGQDNITVVVVDL